MDPVARHSFRVSAACMQRRVSGFSIRNGKNSGLISGMMSFLLYKEREAPIIIHRARRNTV